MAPDQVRPQPVVEWNGRPWKIVRPSIEVEIMLKAHLERQAMLAVIANASLLGDHRIAAFQGVSRDVASRYYAWGRPGCEAALADNENFCLLLHWTISKVEGQTGLTMDQMRQFWKDKAEEISLAWEAALGIQRPEGNGRPL